MQRYIIIAEYAEARVKELESYIDSLRERLREAHSKSFDFVITYEGHAKELQEALEQLRKRVLELANRGD